LLKIKTKTIAPEKQKLAAEFWDAVSKNIPEWSLLVERKIVTSELRENYVHAHTNILNSLGMVGHVLTSKFPDTWKSQLKGLQKIDWARDSPIWEGKIMLDGKMLKQKAGIRKAANVILNECGVTTTVEEFEKNEAK
jgi:DNA sulfur modification protein DndB